MQSIFRNILLFLQQALQMKIKILGLMRVSLSVFFEYFRAIFMVF